MPRSRGAIRAVKGKAKAKRGGASKGKSSKRAKLSDNPELEQALQAAVFHEHLERIGKMPI